MIIEENWEFFPDLEGYTTFAVSDSDEDLFELLYSITQYLCLFDEEFHGDFNIEWGCTIHNPNEPNKVEFLTNLPYELFELYN